MYTPLEKVKTRLMYCLSLIVLTNFDVLSLIGLVMLIQIELKIKFNVK